MKKYVGLLVMVLWLTGCQIDNDEKRADDGGNSLETTLLMNSEAQLNESGCFFQGEAGRVALECSEEKGVLDLSTLIAIDIFADGSRALLNNDKSEEYLGDSSFEHKSFLTSVYMETLSIQGSLYFLSATLEENNLLEFNFGSRKELYSHYASICLFRYGLKFYGDNIDLGKQVMDMESEKLQALLQITEQFSAIDRFYPEDTKDKNALSLQQLSEQILEWQK